MIEFCTRKRMVIAIAFLILLSVVVVIIENEWTPGDLHHRSHNKLHENITELEDCWMREKFETLEDCQPCTVFEMESNIKPCEFAKYRQKIKCSKTGIVKRKCDRVVWLEEKQFILFEVSMIAIGFISGSFTFYRQRILDRRIYQKIQKQVAAGV